MNEDRSICPVFVQYLFEDEDFFEVCFVCGCEEDGIQRDDLDYEGGRMK